MSMQKHIDPMTVTARRQPKTQRGRETRDEILAAARTLVCQRWVYETPFVELATAAKVARASLLHLYPHWREVLLDLLTEELAHLDTAFDTASQLKRARPSERAYTMLVPLLDRAEKTGHLYANLRSQMFTWQGEIREDDLNSKPMTPGAVGWFALIPLGDQYGMVEELLGVPKNPSLKPNEYGPAPYGECLLNLALDLAAGSPSKWLSFDERRDTLRSTIEVIAAGIARSTGRRGKMRRT